jgi:hypothetical protein
LPPNAKILFKNEDIFPHTSITFEGHEYLAPHRSIALLESWYGQPFEVPNDMFSHQHFTLGNTAKELHALAEKYKIEVTDDVTASDSEHGNMFKETDETITAFQDRISCLESAFVTYIKYANENLQCLRTLKQDSKSIFNRSKAIDFVANKVSESVKRNNMSVQ